MASKAIEEEVGSISEAAIHLGEGEGPETEMDGELESDYESVPCERVGAKLTCDLDRIKILRQFEHKGKSLYEHLVRIMEYMISTRPANTIDYFDQFSRAFREEKDTVFVSDYIDRALKQTRMYSILSTAKPKVSIPEEEGTEEEEEEEPSKKTATCFLDSADYFQEMDIGLPKNVIYQIDASIRHLSLREGIQKTRFWGMIFGMKRSYFVAECELTHSELELRLRHEKMPMFEGEEGEEEEELSIPPQPSFFGFSSFFINDAEEFDSPYKKLARYRIPPLPIPARKQKVKMMKEFIGEGTNKNVYYVCHEPGEEWLELPDVLPEQIVAARQIRKYFQGNLSAEVVCYPPFPGKEREYLRAQIARISAGTHISPIGYYQFGSSDEMEGEGQNETDVVVNLDYEVIPYQDMLNAGFWVHHVPHILRIGRTTYWEQHKATGEEVEDEEREEKEETSNKETGPPLLTPLSEDINLFGVNPWTIRATSKLIPGSGVISVTSNLWPGAYCVNRGRYFENVYLGFGLKYSDGYSPLRPPFPEKEYEVGPEISETQDPTPEEEEEWRKIHEPPPTPPYIGEGEGEEEMGPPYPEPDSEHS